MAINKDEFCEEIKKYLKIVDTFFINLKPDKYVWEIMTIADMATIELSLKESDKYELDIIFSEWEEALPYLDQEDLALDKVNKVYRIKAKRAKEAIDILIFFLRPLFIKKDI